MSHPLTRITASERKPIFWILFGLTIGFMIVMNLAATPLMNGSAPNGIVSFEIAGSLKSADKIIRSWDQADISWRLSRLDWISYSLFYTLRLAGWHARGVERYLLRGIGL